MLHGKRTSLKAIIVSDAVMPLEAGKPNISGPFSFVSLFLIKIYLWNLSEVEIKRFSVDPEMELLVYMIRPWVLTAPS